MLQLAQDVHLRCIGSSRSSRAGKVKMSRNSNGCTAVQHEDAGPGAAGSASAAKGLD